MNIGLTRGKPEPVKSADYKQIDRKIKLLQAKSTAIYENDDLDDTEVDEIVSKINAEIAGLIEQLYIR